MGEGGRVDSRWVQRVVEGGAWVGETWVGVDSIYFIRCCGVFGYIGYVYECHFHVS